MAITLVALTATSQAEPMDTEVMVMAVQGRRIAAVMARLMVTAAD